MAVNFEWCSHFWQLELGHSVGLEESKHSMHVSSLHINTASPQCCTALHKLFKRLSYRPPWEFKTTLKHAYPAPPAAFSVRLKHIKNIFYNNNRWKSQATEGRVFLPLSHGEPQHLNFLQKTLLASQPIMHHCCPGLLKALARPGTTSCERLPEQYNLDPMQTPHHLPTPRKGQLAPLVQ